MEIILRLLVLVIFLCFSLVNGQNYNVLDFDATGDGETDDSNAFLKTWNAACGGGGDISILLIPAGRTFLIQPILEGIIVAPSNKEEWSNPNSRMWIKFSAVVGLVIVGSGTINGRGSSFWEQHLKASQRPTSLHISKCDNLIISRITSIDSPKNHISIAACTNVAVSNIGLFAPEDSPNTDGIDISRSTNVNIFDSTIQTGDDCIAINTGNTNINITRINCGPGHGISVGSLGVNGGNAAVSDVQVTQCIFNQTMNGARIKTWPGGQGYARNISFENITLINAKNPIIIDQQYIDKGRVYSAEKSAVAISNIKFIDFRGTTSKKNAIKIDCSATTRCKDVLMNGINITMVDGKQPRVDCKNVDGKSEDTFLTHDCFENV
ncbi:hypothetical protein N665_0204s0027 [Sinapis alba]|nr:hypothetical protein N665_0204s0027 [Sinapis alba]